MCIKWQENASPIQKIQKVTKEEYNEKFSNHQWIQFKFGEDKNIVMYYETRDILKKKYKG